MDEQTEKRTEAETMLEITKVVMVRDQEIARLRAQLDAQRADTDHIEGAAKKLGWHPDMNTTAALWLQSRAELVSRHAPGCPHHRNEAQCIFNLSDEDSYDCCTCLKNFVSTHRFDQLKTLFDKATRLLLYAGDASVGGMMESWRNDKNQMLALAKTFGFVAAEYQHSHSERDHVDGSLPAARHIFEEGGIDALKAAYDELAQLGGYKPSPERERIALWAHLVSKHCAIIDLDSPMVDLEDLHQHEHNGPGGIRNHDEKSRSFSLKKLGEVLSESEDEDEDDDD